MFEPAGCHKPILVAGYGGEMNCNREIHITANAHQLALVYGLYADLNMMKSCWDSSSSFTPDVSMLPQLPEKHCQEGMRSAASSVKEVDSGVESGNIPHVPTPQVIPLDLFIAATNVRITTYDLVYKSSGGRSVEQDMDTLSGIKPLLMLNIVQPYLVGAVSSTNQKVEFSIFDITVGMGSGFPRNLLLHSFIVTF